jgi:hypothetical protein
MKPGRIAAALMIATAGLLLIQCGQENGTTQPDKIPPVVTTIDTIPPADIYDLVAINPSVSAVYITWTAPGDDGDQGTASSYDIRYHDEIIDEQNWDAAEPFVYDTAPKTGGQLESARILLLDPVTTYFFAIKITDDEGNVSGLSNVPSSTTLQENTPPNSVPDLEAVAMDGQQALLTWTAPGDDWEQGTARRYQIRFSARPISEGNWTSATLVPSPPAPKPGGEPESLLVSGVPPMQSHYFAVKAADEVPNWSGISNLAYAMGYSVYLEVSDNYVNPGQEITIRFRSTGSGNITMLLKQYGIWDCNPGHVWVKDLIIPGSGFAEGIYEIPYDFSRPQGGYLPPATYYIVMCVDYEVQTTKVVYFEDP